MSQKRSRRRKSRLPEENVEVEITAMSNEGRGIAHVDERTVFIDQALVGERVLFKYSRLTKNIAEGRAVEILRSSDLRVEPKCSAFELCAVVVCSICLLRLRSTLNRRCCSTS